MGQANLGLFGLIPRQTTPKKSGKTKGMACINGLLPKNWCFQILAINQTPTLCQIFGKTQNDNDQNKSFASQILGRTLPMC